MFHTVPDDVIAIESCLAIEVRHLYAVNFENFKQDGRHIQAAWLQVYKATSCPYAEIKQQQKSLKALLNTDNWKPSCYIQDQPLFALQEIFERSPFMNNMQFLSTLALLAVAVSARPRPDGSAQGNATDPADDSATLLSSCTEDMLPCVAVHWFPDLINWSVLGHSPPPSFLCFFFLGWHWLTTFLRGNADPNDVIS